MKKAAVIALVLTLLLGGLLLYGWINTQLVIIPLSAQVIPGEEQPGEFQRLQKAIDNRGLIGTAFADELPGEAKDYIFVIYTLSIENRGFLTAEMVEMQAAPASGDMLCYTDLSAQGRLPDISVPAGGKGSIRCVLLARADGRANTVRDLYVSYYIWGHPFTIKLTYG